MNITYPIIKEEHSRIPSDHWLLLDTLPSNIRVDKTKIYIDDVLVESSTKLTAHQLAWMRELPHGGMEEGVIHFHPHRLSGYGKIILSPGDLDVREPYVIYFNAHLSSRSYVCELLTSNMAKYEGKAHGVRSFHFGHRESLSDQILTCKVDGMQPDLELFDIGQKLFFSVNEYNEATFGFSRLSGTFSRDYTSFKGEAVQYNPHMLAGEGETFIWNGRLTTGRKPINIEIVPQLKYILPATSV